MGATSISGLFVAIPSRTASATSSGVRRRPEPAGSFSPVSPQRPVSAMKPGKTAVTPTPVFRRSSCRASAKPRSPNFVAAYSDAPTDGVLPAIDEM